MARYLGIDFSGGAAPWRARVSRPTVWIAIVDGSSLSELFPVQDLPGTEPPFLKLVSFLAARDFDAAAIDAPFSLPERHLPLGGHQGLIEEVAKLPNGSDRPFPLGADIVRLGETRAHKEKPKPLRLTELYWAARGVNTRSTMWNGPRGGAPFAAACLRLIALSSNPCWPWTSPCRGVLAEAFPAAQLKQWDLPHRAYSKPDAGSKRTEILNNLKSRIDVRSRDESLIIDLPDALDAVVASFAAAAVCEQKVVGYDQAYADGVIAVAK